MKLHLTSQPPSCAPSNCIEGLLCPFGPCGASFLHVKAMLCSATCGSVGRFWRLCRAIRKPCWDHVLPLLPLLTASEGYAGTFGTFGGYVGTMLGRQGALLVSFERYVGPFGSYVGPLGSHVGPISRRLGSLIHNNQGLL